MMEKILNSLKAFFSFIWESLQILLISAAIVLPVRYFLIQPFFVLGASMEPNFQEGNYLIIDEITYRFSEPKRGDIVVFKYPKDPTQYFIKRIVGLPEETVEIKNGSVWITSGRDKKEFELDESGYLPYHNKTGGDLRMKLDKEEYFVLGDNRLMSSDSRKFGAVNREFIVGKTWIRAFPLNKLAVY